MNHLILGQINIISIRNKFELVFSLVSNNIDVLLISETKINNTFPVSQFCVPGYSVPFRLDRTPNGGGIMLYVKEHIPCRMLSKFTFEKEIEAFAIEINLRKITWLLVCSCNPNFCNLPVHLNAIDKAIEFYSKAYDKILVAEDFNAQVSGVKLDTLSSIWSLKSLGKEPTCFKNPNNPSFIDLLLTNTISFQQTQVFETGLSDIHNLVVTVLKSTFPKSASNIITYGSYKNLSNDLLLEGLNSLLSKGNMTLEFTSLTSFTKILIETLNKHATIKKKNIRENHADFVTKGLRKAIVLRSRLRNIF